MEGVFAIDITKESLLRFTNAVEEDEENSLQYARFVVDLASAMGALDGFVIYNEFRLRADPNKSPFTGIPLINTDKMLEFIKFDDSVPRQLSIHIPFPIPNMQSPFVTIDTQPVLDPVDGRPVICQDFGLGSESVKGSTLYTISISDSMEEDFMRIVFMPKTGPTGQPLLDRPDYRQFKRPRLTAL